MTRSIALFFLACLLPLSAQAEEPVVPAKKVDFSKKPQRVENYNKYRFTAKLTKLKDGSQRVDLEGKAYYPDDVLLVVGLRYWKLKGYFLTAKTRVKDRAFKTSLGPFHRAIPAGKLAVEVYFILRRQKKTVQKVMLETPYHSCSPPCRFDKLNLTRVYVETGGKRGQAKSEAEEKGEAKKALEAALSAREVARIKFEQARKKKRADAAKAALKTLEGDLQAAKQGLSRWKGTRQFLLFPKQLARIETLISHVAAEGALHAISSGAEAPSPSWPRVKSARGFASTFARYAKARKSIAEDLLKARAFLVEKGSIDRLWDELGESAKAKAKARKVQIEAEKKRKKAEKKK